MRDFHEVFPECKFRADRELHIKEIEEKFIQDFKYDAWNFKKFDKPQNWDMCNDEDGFFVYNLCGALCCRMLKRKIDCSCCRQAFANSTENLIEGVEAATLVNEKNEGGLIHPNMNLFNLCWAQEAGFAYRLARNYNNIFHSTIKNVAKCENYMTFPCELHGPRTLATIMYDYIHMRMRQYATYVKRSQEKVSKEKRKNAKHEDT